jgi:hypothetical protein
VTFSPSLNHRRIGDGWASWSHGYTGDVYYARGEHTVTLTLPPQTRAFAFYAEPNHQAVFDITATTSDGATSGAVPVDGSGGARFFGFFATAGSFVSSIVVASPDDDFAIGEFSICTQPLRRLTHLDDVVLWASVPRGTGAPKGAPFDFMVELLHNGVPVASGSAQCVAVGGDDPWSPTAVTVGWAPFAPVDVAPGDVLALRVSARAGTTADGGSCAPPRGHGYGRDGNGDEGGGAGGQGAATGSDDDPNGGVEAANGWHPDRPLPVRISYGTASLASGFGMTIDPDGVVRLFLESDGCACGQDQSTGVTARTLEQQPPGYGPALCVDSDPLGFLDGNPWHEIAVWSRAPLS